MDEMCYIIVPNHVINDYHFKQLICNDFNITNYFCPLWLKYYSETQSYVWNFLLMLHRS
jgi:hypothetical protein